MTFWITSRLYAPRQDAARRMRPPPPRVQRESRRTFVALPSPGLTPAFRSRRTGATRGAAAGRDCADGAVGGVSLQVDTASWVAPPFASASHIRCAFEPGSGAD